MSDAADTNTDTMVSIRAEARQLARRATYQIDAMLAALRHEAASGKADNLPWLVQGVLIRVEQLNGIVVDVLDDDDPQCPGSLDEMHRVVLGEFRGRGAP